MKKHKLLKKNNNEPKKTEKSLIEHSDKLFDAYMSEEIDYNQVIADLYTTDKILTFYYDISSKKIKYTSNTLENKAVDIYFTLDCSLFDLSDIGHYLSTMPGYYIHHSIPTNTYYLINSLKEERTIITNDTLLDLKETRLKFTDIMKNDIQNRIRNCHKCSQSYK